MIEKTEKGRFDPPQETFGSHFFFMDRPQVPLKVVAKRTSNWQRT